MAGLFDQEQLKKAALRHPSALQIGDRERRYLAGAAFFALAVLGLGLVEAEFSLSRILTGAGRLGDFAVLMIPPDPGQNFQLYLNSMLETLAIAFLGTSIAAILAFPVAVLAARNVLPLWAFRFCLRRGLDTIRGVDTLIWALIWISVVGMGPFAGVLAMATSDFATFGKLFSETIETAQRRPVEGIRSTGGSLGHEFRYGIFPQVMPVIAGQALYYFESNTRSATIIGIVGAGGIGLHLSEAIRTLEWRQVSFIIIMVLLVVGLIDFISSRLRQAIAGVKPV